MKLTNEQIQEILDGAPEGATKFAEYVDCYYFKPAIPHGLKLYSPFVDKWQWVHDCSMLRNLRDLSDLREILELRQEVERMKTNREIAYEKWQATYQQLKDGMTLYECYECGTKVHELSPRSRCCMCEYGRANFNEKENNRLRDKSDETY